jgi:hypothetical protein
LLIARYIFTRNGGRELAVLRPNMKWILTALMLLSTTANAGTYFTGTAGLVQYGHEDNKWYQDSHTNSKSYVSGTASLGVGYNFSSQWAIESNVRYLAGGSIKSAEWEQDATYGMPGANHSPTDFDGRSWWSVAGLSIDGVRSFPITYTSITGFYRVGAMYYQERWRTRFIEPAASSHYTTHIADCKKATPLAGIGGRFGKDRNYSLEVTRYFDLQCQEGGVSAATSLTFGVRF